MKRVLIWAAIVVAAVIIFGAPFMLLSHKQDLYCCVKPIDVLGNAQSLHSATDTPAMCRQAHGNIVWVDGLFVGCVHGNVIGVTTP